MKTHVRKLLILACILISGQLCLAQENVLLISHAESKIPAILIAGYVSAEDSIPLVGALVRIPGTSLGTVTDENGYFQLNVPKKDIGQDTLEISYITMASQKIPMSSLKGQLRVYLKYPSLKELDILAYGPTRRSDIMYCGGSRSYCGNIGLITLNKPLPDRIVTQPEQFAQGKVIIRCGGSISGHGPLYVVDGVPYNEISSSLFNTLAPEDIKEIHILKGNVASALYGSRGHYGVIIITTHYKRGFGNLKSFSYSGLLGLAQLNGTSLASPQLTFSQFLKFIKTTPSYKLNISGNVRKLPGFEENQSRNHFGGNVFYSRLALDKKLEFGSRLSFNHIRERTPVLADIVKKQGKEQQFATRTFNNYFAQAFARYTIDDFFKANVDLSGYQNENLLFDRLGGNFFKPQLNFAREFDYRHQVRAEAYFSTQSTSGAEQPYLQQLSGGVKASYEYDRLLEGEIIVRKETNALVSQSEQISAQYLSARARVNYDNLDLDPGGICAVSRGYLQARANLNQTPFFSQNTFALESQIGIGSQFRLNAGYTFASEQVAHSPIPQDISLLGFFPAVYQVLENQGLEMNVSFYKKRGDFLFDSRLDYHRGNGLAREMMSFNNLFKWRKLSFETGMEGFRGWKLSGGERDFFRLSFMDLSYDLEDIPQLNLKNVKLSLSGQNLLSMGDQQVWKDQIELSRLRDPSQFPVPLARNLLFGVKMDIL